MIAGNYSNKKAHPERDGLFALLIGAATKLLSSGRSDSAHADWRSDVSIPSLPRMRKASSILFVEKQSGPNSYHDAVLPLRKGVRYPPH